MTTQIKFREKLRNLVRPTEDRKLARSRGFQTVQDMKDFDRFDRGENLPQADVVRLRELYEPKISESELMQELKKLGGGSACYFALAVMTADDLDKEKGEFYTFKYAGPVAFARKLILQTDSFLLETSQLVKQFDSDKKARTPYTGPFKDTTAFLTHVLKKLESERRQNKNE